MAVCINTNTREYQELLALSGISEFSLKVFASNFIEQFGRFPELDEIPNADSSKALIKSLDIHDDIVDNSKLLDYTKSNDIQSAVIALNNLHKDLEISIIPLFSKSVISINKRPNKWTKSYDESMEIDKSFSIQKNRSVFNSIVNKLQNLYGIKVNQITSAELGQEQWKDIVQDVDNVNAFIYNNEIYINTDIARIDAPIHELLHILLGSIKFSDQELYSYIINSVESLDNYEQLNKQYSNRTRSDINEEIFVSEFAKYLTNQNSLIKNLDKGLVNKIYYNITRVSDTIISGQRSAQTVDSQKLLSSSIIDLCDLLGSDLINPKSMFEIAQTSRVLANKKSDLMEQNKLKEYCE